MSKNISSTQNQPKKEYFVESEYDDYADLVSRAKNSSKPDYFNLSDLQEY